MLTEERLQGIERIVKEKGSASIPELMERMGISESTARRDLTLLDKQGRLQKVRGGAMIISDVYSTQEDTVLQKKDRNLEEKVEIAKYAASLIEPNDFVYLDAGTTTELMIDYLTEKDITFVTNAVHMLGNFRWRVIQRIFLAESLRQRQRQLLAMKQLKVYKNIILQKAFGEQMVYIRN